MRLRNRWEFSKILSKEIIIFAWINPFNDCHLVPSISNSFLCVLIEIQLSRVVKIKTAIALLHVNLVENTRLVPETET